MARGDRRALTTAAEPVAFGIRGEWFVDGS